MTDEQFETITAQLDSIIELLGILTREGRERQRVAEQIMRSNEALGGRLVDEAGERSGGEA